jgi:MoxR-vWA-beta-propeller ternary system domain bpX6
MTELEVATRPRAAEIRQPLLQGTQPVEGLWFPADWFDDRHSVPRILAAWRPGSRLFRFDAGLLLRFDTSIDMPCESAGGWPLRREGGTLSSAPMDAAERAHLPAADVWIVAGARVAALQLGDATLIDPSTWLDIDRYTLHDSYDCRTALNPAFTLAVTEPRDLRSVLGNAVPPASEAQVEFLRKLAQSQGQLATARPAAGAAAPAGTAGPSWRWARVVAIGLMLIPIAIGLHHGWPSGGFPGDAGTAPDRATGGTAFNLALLPILAAIGLILSLVLRAARSKQSTWLADPWPSQPQGVAAPTPAKPGRGIKPRGLADRFAPQRWRDWLARLAITSQVARLLGRRQGAYLRKMLELFDNGDLDEALRHAIPLGGDGPNLGQAFGTPSARKDLALSRQLGGRTSISLGQDLNAHLRALYRQSFERLDRAGRIDEAVFVLAELLSARKEALDYLEKHERFAQAAELALAWDMPADLIVRLNCLAGDWRMALAVARRDNAFANAVTQLAPKWPDAARRLRREWGEALAGRGEWLQAVDAIWPIEEQRKQAAEWLRSAESAGGALGARGLVRRAALLPDTVSVHADALALLRDDPAAGLERNEVAKALLAQKEHSPATQRIASLLIGAILADHARGNGILASKDLQSLVTKAGDPMLNADLPSAALPGALGKPLAVHNPPLILHAPERGAQAILDAVPIEAGRYLVALGEAGALLVDRFGKILSRFAVPAHKLVIAHSRQIALALAPRDGLWRISRLDLANRKVTDLGMLACTHFAPEFDGIGWTVAFEDRLCVLDTAGTLRDVLWQVSALPGPILALTHSPLIEQIVVDEGPYGLTLWKYQLPHRRLMSRDEVLPAVPDGGFGVLDPTGGYLEGWIGKTAQGPDALHLRQNKRVRQIPLRDELLVPTPTITCCSVDKNWAIIRFSDAARSRSLFFHSNHNRVSAEIVWPSAKGTRLRMTGVDCLFFDEEGRVLHLDAETSQAVGFALR